MKKYIGFLRGINVGGNNKISMPVLKECFEENGFQNVITYLNSGNIIFSTQEVDEKAKHNAIFILPTVTVKEVFDKVGEAKPEYEKVDYYGNVVFWSAPIQTFSKTRWSKVVGSSVYQYVTIRNANTIKKITQLIKESN
ncbi:MAG: DUF1697 domain-containing protein [Clostridiales bacterium]|nr:DUF1697 domain-containing protein [Clostridiales bacterium]